MRGLNDERFGIWFLDMLVIYDCKLNVKVSDIVKLYDICMYEGVYYGL